MKVPVRISIWASAWNPMIWYGISGFSFSICMLAWWFLMYMPIKTILAGYSAYNVSLRTQCIENTVAIQSLRHSKEAVSSLRDRLFDQQQLHTGIDWVSIIMEKADAVGLHIRSYQTDSEFQKASYNALRARFELIGSWEKMVSFLSEIQKDNRCLSCKEWSLTALDKQSYTFTCLLQYVAFLQTTCVTK